MSESGGYHELERTVHKMYRARRRHWPDRHPVALAAILVGWFLVMVFAEQLADGLIWLASL